MKAIRRRSEMKFKKFKKKIDNIDDDEFDTLLKGSNNKIKLKILKVVINKYENYKLAEKIIRSIDIQDVKYFLKMREVVKESITIIKSRYKKKRDLVEFLEDKLSMSFYHTA